MKFKKNTLIKIISATSFFILSQSTFAFLPVIDIGAITQLINEYNEMKLQYAQLQQTCQSSQQELSTTQELAGDEEGHYGYGNLYENAHYTANREWSPDNWQETLQGLSGGNPARYQQLVTQYQANNPTLTPAQYEEGSSSSNAAIYQQQIQNNQAASVTATYAFNDIKSHLTHINEITAQIESTQDEKAAIDLSTRMQAEIAYVQIEMLKQMTIMNEQMASNNSNNIQYETQAAEFNKLPDE